jgi:dephospho-CoA kinase
VKKPIQIGITGGIGTGKSLVCKIFNVLKVPSYDADSRAKAVMTTDGILVEAIQKEFGTLAYQVNGELDRTYLSKIVFSDEFKLRKLNSLVHPRVAVDYEHWLHQQTEEPYILKEAALLFESGSYKSLSKVVVVSAPMGVRVKRVLQRDMQRDEEQIKGIMAKQMSEEEKWKLADYKIENDERHSLITQCLTLHQEFLKLSNA